MLVTPFRHSSAALVAPHRTLTSDDDRLGARLFAILLLVQIAVALVSLVAIDAILSRAFGRHIWGQTNAHAVLAGCGLLALAYGLIRAGYYRPGVTIYIGSALAVALGAPFSGEPTAEIGLLASAVIPVLLASIAFDHRWVLGILGATLLSATALLFTSDLTSDRRRMSTGLALIVCVAVTGALIVAYRRHLKVLEARRLARLREGEEAARKSGAQYRYLFEAISDAILIAGEDGRIVEANKAACRDLGYAREELVGTPIDRIWARPPGAVEETQHLASAHGRRAVETLHIRKDGTVMPVELIVTAVEFEGRPAFLGIARDLTARRRDEEERQRMADQLQQAAKMESVGVLAGGVAHDFNNLLTAVLGNAELAAQEVEPGSSLASSLSEIQKAATSATALTRQLLAFSRKQVIEPRVIDLNELVGRMHTMLRRLIGEDIHLQTTLAVAPARIRADPGLIEQVIINLAVNARDAMPDGGVLAIETAIVGPDVEPAGSPEPSPGSRVRLVVSDTGVGMPREVLAHLFEPFFTTKPKGRGTGLGLATAYGAVTQAGGTIEVSSEPGNGSSFRILLPLAAGSGVEPLTQDALPVAEGGRETILFVEDDDGVRGLGQRILEGQGYRVLAAPDGPSAVAVSQRYAGPIDLLMTDVVMPGMNGRQLVEEIVAHRPAIRVLFTSGYTDDAVIQRGVHSDDFAFIAKPYSPLSLAAKIREILDRA